MKAFIKILLLLKSTMTRPVSYGWFHFLCVAITLTIILLLYFSEKKNGYNKNKLKKILLIYGVIALLLEILKQIIWSFNYNGVNSIGIINGMQLHFNYVQCQHIVL